MQTQQANLASDDSIQPATAGKKGGGQTPKLPKLPRGVDLRPYRSEYASDRDRLRSKLAVIERIQKDLPKEMRNAEPDEKHQLFKVAQDVEAERFHLLSDLRDDLIQWHGDEQFLSANTLLSSALFGVSQGTGEESEKVKLTLVDQSKAPVLSYKGPRLNQTDGLVFLSLTNIAQDFYPGTPVSFDVAALCRAIFNRYDGSARCQLHIRISRLQQGVLRQGTTQVQLVGKFEFPSMGPWTISLDKDVLALFRNAQSVWMQRTLRTRLPPGLATWLYGYIRTRVQLREMPVSLLMQMCGSQSTKKNFYGPLRDALSCLAEANVIAKGWEIKRGGYLHWVKGCDG